MNLVYMLIVFSLLYVLQMFFGRNIFLKLVVVTYLFLASSAVYFSFDTYKGWPSEEKIQKGILVSVEIIQPSDDHKGAIYLWIYDEKRDATFIQKVFGYSTIIPAPRAYAIPYSESAKGMFEDAKKQIEMGMTVEVTGEKALVEGEEREGGETDENANASMSGTEEYDAPSIRIIPPNEILRKD